MKRSVIAPILVAAIATCLVLLPRPGAQASPDAPITIFIKGEVAEVFDPDNILGGAINVGDPIFGSYTYDPATSDSDPLPTRGEYLHTSPPYGIAVNAGGFHFETDPSNVDFEVAISNDQGSPPEDYYVLWSNSNLPLWNGALVEAIGWQLDDPTGTALSSDALPTVPPTLSDWESIFGLNAYGRSGIYNVRAHVMYAGLTPPPPLTVEVDIKPGGDRNSISRRGRGKIPVAILSSPTFDAPGQVDKASLTFGVTGDEDSLAFCRETVDVNSDGLLDQVCHFNARDTGFECGDTEGILRGQTVGGLPMEGRDSVRIVPCR